MAAKKTLIKRTEVDEALRAHNCQHNSNHRLEHGDRRLKVWKDRSPEHFCRVCALEIIERDIERLRELMRQLEGDTGLPKPAALTDSLRAPHRART